MKRLFSVAVVAVVSALGCTGAVQEPRVMPDGAIAVDGKWYVPLTKDYNPPQIDLTIPAKDLPLDQLAQAISPILGRDGKLYRALDPDYDTAQAIKEGKLLNGGGSMGRRPETLQYLFNPSSPGNPQVNNYESSIGSSYPYSTVVYIQAWNGGGNQQGSEATCTGTYVGAHTLITAAHCVSNNGTQWGNDMQFTPAAWGYGGNVSGAPYGQYYGCYDWWYPSAWSSSCPGTDSYGSGCAQYDYAVVDFRRCGNPTINNTGWMGVIVNDSSLPSVELDGYPGFYTLSGSPPNNVSGSTYPGCGSNNNPNGKFPFECGMSGPGDLNSDGWSIESDTVSGGPGVSGGPWWVNLSGNPYCDGPCVAGTNIGDRAYFDLYKCGFNDCYRNYGHLVDTAAWNFFTSHSEL